jgi:ADP-ribose pyrophosphatase YjhB (NUDIX family)
VKYCPMCAAELGTRLEGGRDRVACPSCSYLFFGDFSIGCGGVVIRDGKALLIRRGHEPGRGWWQIPGGYVEYDEVITDAVAREVQEEAGVRAKVIDVLGIRHSVGGAGSIGGPSSNVYVMFRLEPLGGEPICDGNEVTGAGYFSMEEIAAMDRVQSLSKFGIERALSGRPGFTPAQAGSDPNRPSWVLYGLPV